MLERYGHTGQKGLENTLLRGAQDKWLHAMAGQHGKQRVIEEDRETQEATPAVLLPEVKGNETPVTSEVGHIQGLPMLRYPADDIQVKAQCLRWHRHGGCRAPEGAGVQHASHCIDAPEGCCQGAHEGRGTAGRLIHNLVEIE